MNSKCSWELARDEVLADHPHNLLVFTTTVSGYSDAIPAGILQRYALLSRLFHVFSVLRCTIILPLRLLSSLGPGFLGANFWMAALPRQCCSIFTAVCYRAILLSMLSIQMRMGIVLKASMHCLIRHPFSNLRCSERVYSGLLQLSL